MNNINFNELTTKGFCVVRNFLNTDELSLVSKDFNLIKETKFKILTLIFFLLENILI